MTKANDYDLREIMNLFRLRCALDGTGYAVIERMHGPNVGVKAIEARGHARAWAWMLTALHHYPVEVPAPTWQKVMLEGVLGDDTKDRALVAARNLWPDANFTMERARKPHDGVVDALLLAEYGRRTWRQQI
jgi:hypothetical protein